MLLLANIGQDRTKCTFEKTKQNKTRKKQNKNKNENEIYKAK